MKTVLKKWWWLLPIIAIALVIGWEEKRCQAQSYECRAGYAAQVQLERLAKRQSVYEQAAEDQAITAACEPNGYFCRLFGSANLPTMLLVFVGIGAIWAALRTLNAIKAQVDTQIRSERAYVDAQLIKKQIAGAIRYDLSITNHGKTPARVSSYELKFGRIGSNKQFSMNMLQRETYVSIYGFLGSGETKTIDTTVSPEQLLSIVTEVVPEPNKEFICITVNYGDVVVTKPDDFVTRKSVFVYKWLPLVKTIHPLTLYTRYQ